MMDKLDRRRFLTVLGAASGVAAGGALWNRDGKKLAPKRALAPRAVVSDADVRAFFGPLASGAQIDRWTIVQVGDSSSGGVPVVMSTRDGARFQVDVLARDDAQPGVAHARGLSVYLCNQGDGRVASDEEQGLGAMALARALEAREAAGAP